MNSKQFTESTTSGAIASVSTPVGKTQTRGKGVYPNEKGGNLLTGKVVEVLNTKATGTWDISSPNWTGMDNFMFTASNGVLYQLDFLHPYIGPDELGPESFDFATNLDDAVWDKLVNSAKFISFEQVNVNDKYEPGKQGIEGTGAAAEVFGSVVNAIFDYIKKKRPSMLYFQAVEPNRIRLYKSMINRLLKKLPGWNAEQAGSRGAHFAVYNEQLLKRLVSKKVKPMKEAQSMSQSLSNTLSKAEPGSKLDQKIKHHNSQVKQTGKGTLDKAPTGYHMDKKGYIRLGVSEAKLDEEDVIIVPGQGNRIKPGFIPKDKDRTDHEVEMAKSDLFQANKNAKKIYELIKDIPETAGLEGWVQEKIIKANDYLNTVREYLEHKELSEDTIEGKRDNFTIDDIKALERIRDLETIKTRAKELIKGFPDRRMKPEKIDYFYNRIDSLASPMQVIKLMYDLLLAGEGMKTIGSRYSTSANTYQRRFNEMTGGVIAGGGVGEGMAEGSDNLTYIGNCTDDDVIEHIFGDATNFAQAVEEYGDEFTIDDLVVKYDPETDVHSFYYKKQGVAEGGPFSYGVKKPRKGSVAYWADKKRKEQERDKPIIEPKDQKVGVAKVTKDVTEGVYSDKLDAYIAKLEAKPKLTKREWMLLGTAKDYRNERAKKAADNSDHRDAPSKKGIKEGEESDFRKLQLMWQQEMLNITENTGNVIMKNKKRERLVSDNQRITESYTKVNTSLAKWKELILQAYPDATFQKMPEDQGGGRIAWSGETFVGDWDGGGDGVPGRILDKVNEGLADDMMSLAKELGMNPQSRDLKNRVTKPASKPVKRNKLSAEKVAELKKRLSDLEAKLDPNFERSDDYGVYLHNRNIAQQISQIKNLLKDQDDSLDEGIVGKVLGGAALLAALWGIGQHQAQQVYSNSPQLQTLIKYHQMATQQGDQAKIQELERRIENHKTRLSLGKGEVMGPDDKPIVPRYESSIMKGIQNEAKKIPDKCPECGGKLVAESELNEEGNKDACYHKVKSRYKVWPSAYASGALVKCRKVGAKNWGNKSK